MHNIVAILLMAALVNAQQNQYSTGTFAQAQQQKPELQATSPHHVLADPALDNYDDSYKATFGELNLGRDFFEGDILLTKQQSDYILESQRDNGLQTRAIMKNVKNLWPNGEMPYVIGDGLREESKDYVKSAIQEWQEKTCVKIRPKKESDEDYIEFVYDGGCSSYVGKVGGKQTISIGSDDGSVTCKHGNIVHEMAHSLGFFHEHSRPDRDEFIKVKYDNIQPGYERNFRAESFKTIDSRGVGYDYDSVMHYGSYFFAKDTNMKTIETKEKDAHIGQRKGLSELDQEQARLLYGCDGTKRKSKVEKVNKAAKKSKTIHKSTHLKKAISHFMKSKKAHAKDQIENVEYQPAQAAAQANEAPAVNSTSVQFAAVPVNVPQTPQQTTSTKQETATVASTNQNTIPDPTTNQNAAVTASANQNQTTADSTNQNQAPATNNEGAKANNDKTTNFLLSDDDLGEENLGKSYFEGDMILSDDQKQFLESLKSDKPDNQADKRALIKNTTYLWPDRTVYYTFDDGVDEIGRKNAEDAIAHWQEKTCLNFKKRSDEKDYINFVFEGGCASRVGRGGGMQKLTIGSTELRCKKGNIIHEMGHALGFFHEHSRPDRDEFVDVHAKNIMPGYERNFLKFSTKFIDSLNVPYDYGSIMHYGKAFFSKLSQLLPTMTILKEADEGGEDIEIGQRVSLSEMDVLQANLLYSCDGRKRLSDDERDELESDYSDPMIREGPCVDTYDVRSCSNIKSKGYCHKFPRTMRRACGNTCQLCSTNPPNYVHAGYKKSSLHAKLKLDHHHHHKQKN